MIEPHLTRRPPRRRRGAILILALICLTAMFAFAALAVDIGYLMNARTEAHRAADSAAVAACWEYVQALADGESVNNASAIARAEAVALASENTVAKVAPNLSLNGNNTNSDVKIGYLANIRDRNAALDYAQSANYNAVEVRIRRNSDMNGPVPLFFARVFGKDNQGVVASATAAILRNVNGFETPGDGSNVDLLPFALDAQTWNGLLAGTGTDNWTWDEDSKSISSGADGIKEVNLYPQGTGSPGNRGTVDIGSSNNSTADIARQILTGISPSDFAAIGGKLEFNSNGVLFLNGDTGISAGVKDELAAIKGQPRVVPVFSAVQGPGNNAMYTINKFIGVRIMEVQLTGSKTNKRVIIQPAPIVASGTIPGTVTGRSDYVYSRVVLVR